MSAEKRLRLEKEKARQYFDVAAVMLVALDSLGNIALINQRGCEILGYREEELTGKSWFDTVIPEAFGIGRSGVKMGDRLHPGGSSVIFSVETIVGFRFCWILSRSE